MKNINSSYITLTALQPFKQGTWEHLQSSFKEVFLALGNFLRIDDYSAFTPLILYGCEYSLSGSTWTITEGWILYSGEFFHVPAATGSTSGGNVPVFTKTASYYTDAKADPVTFTDSSTQNVHEIWEMILTSAGTGTGTADYSTAERIKSPQVGLKSGLTWTTGSTYTIDFNRSQSLFFPTSLGTGGFIGFDLTNPARGTIKQMYGSISGGGQIAFNNTPAYLHIKKSGAAPTVTDITGGGLIAFTTGGNYCLEIEYLGYYSSYHHISVKVYGI